MPVTSLDVSIDGSFIQSCDVADNLLFFSTRTGERVTAEAVKDSDWVTQSVGVGWAMQGLWPVVGDGSAITAADRSTEGTSCKWAYRWGVAITAPSLNMISTV